MKWSPAWCGYIVQPNDARELSALCCEVGDVVFFDPPGAVVEFRCPARPVAIRRRGSDHIECLNVGHAARWQEWCAPAKVAPTISDLVRGDYKVESTATGLSARSKMLRDQCDAMTLAAAALQQEVVDRCYGFLVADELVESADVYDAAMGVLVGKVRERKPLALPIDDSNQMTKYDGCRVSDGGNHHKAPPPPLRRYPRRARRAPFGIDTLAPQSGFCSSGVIYGAMSDE